MTVRLETFELERWQSTWEHGVDCNLSESGVHPMTVRELLALPGGDTGLDAERLLDQRLIYPQTNGTPELRERIAALYPGAGPDHVLVTHGGAEANFLVSFRIVEPGDEVVVLLPNYLQTHGIVRGLGARVVPWELREEHGWNPDPGELDELVTERTALIVLTTPNNPAGRILREPALDAVAAAAARVGAWVLSDEIYRGAELGDAEAPSMWGRCDRLFVSAGLSKAYGLPGLRTGWVASPDPACIERLWAARDYTTIASSPLTMALAAHALEPARRAAIRERTRAILRRNLDAARGWLDERADLFRYAPPEAGAILWTRYALELGSAELAERLRAEESTLVCAGAQFGVEHHLRLGFGPERESLLEGLARLERLVGRVRARAVP